MPRTRLDGQGQRLGPPDGSAWLLVYRSPRRGTDRSGRLGDPHQLTQSRRRYIAADEPLGRSSGDRSLGADRAPSGAHE